MNYNSMVNNCCRIMTDFSILKNSGITKIQSNPTAQSACMRISAFVIGYLAASQAVRIAWNALSEKGKRCCRSLSLYCSVMTPLISTGYFCFKNISPALGEATLKSVSTRIACAVGLTASIGCGLIFTKESLPVKGNRVEESEDDDEQIISLRSHLLSVSVGSAKIGAACVISLFCYSLFKSPQDALVDSQLFRNAAINTKDLVVAAALKISSFRLPVSMPRL